MLTRITIAAQQRFCKQTVICLLDGGVYGTELQKAGVSLITLDMQRGRPNPFSLVKLSWHLAKIRPEIIMSWMYHADLMSILAAILAGISPRRIIWNLRCSDIVVRHYNRSTRLSIAILAYLSHFPGIVATNSEVGRIHHQRLGYRAREWAYLPNGLDLQIWRPRPEAYTKIRQNLGVSDTEWLIGMVARVDPQKDHNNFLHAASLLVDHHPKTRFLLVGTGTKTLNIPQNIQDRLILMEYRSDIAELMAALDLHILSSAFGEGFPNVVIEAMATAIPCLVTKVGDAAHLVEGHGEAVPPQNPVALTQAISDLLAEGRTALRARGAVARTKIEQNYGLDNVVTQYQTLWQRLAYTNRC